MTQHKRKKTQKYRGSKTHGGGSMKKRRGAGHRGGRGNAGSGKRGDSRKPSYWKSDAFGSGPKGFHSAQRVELETMNVSGLEKDLQLLKEAGHASEKGGVWSVDLVAAGVEKLLGSGRISTKVEVTVPLASAGAVSKVEEAGGSVTVTTVKKEKTKKAEKEKKPADEDDEE